MTTTNKSAGRTLDVLELLASSLRPVPAMAIARRCAIPKSSTHHLLNCLRARGWVVYYEGDRGWGLGAAAFEMGSGYLRAQPVQRLGRVVLRDLSAETRLPCHLAVLRGDEVLFLDRELRRDCAAPRHVPAVGVRLPAHLTAAGRAMLGWLSHDQVRALYPHPVLVKRTLQGPATVKGLLAELDVVRRQGAAIETGLVADGTGSAAAAVLSHEGYPTAALSVTFAAHMCDPATRAHLAAVVRRAAGRMSDAMGVRVHQPVAA